MQQAEYTAFQSLNSEIMIPNGVLNSIELFVFENGTLNLTGQIFSTCGAFVYSMSCAEAVSQGLANDFSVLRDLGQYNVTAGYNKIEGLNLELKDISLIVVEVSAIALDITAFAPYADLQVETNPPSALYCGDSCQVPLQNRRAYISFNVNYSQVAALTVYQFSKKYDSIGNFNLTGTASNVLDRKVHTMSISNCMFPFFYSYYFKPFI